MRFSTASLVAAFSSLALAQNLADLPACARTCFGGNFGNCNTFDVKCICSSTALINTLSCCVAQNCDQADQQTTIQFAQGLCGGQGVSLPSSAGCSSNAASTSGSASSGSTSGSAAAVTMLNGTAIATSGGSSTGSGGSSHMTAASTGATGTKTGGAVASSGTAGGSTGSAEGATGAAAPMQTGLAMGAGMALAGLVMAL